jgi:hypothetical protein
MIINSWLSNMSRVQAVAKPKRERERKREIEREKEAAIETMGSTTGGEHT